MNRLRTIIDHPDSITDTRTFLILSLCLLSSAGGLFFTGSYDGTRSTRPDYHLSITYSNGAYTLTQGDSLTLDDEYTNDSDSKKSYDTSRPPAGGIQLFAPTHPFTQSEELSRNIFHYDTYIGFIPLRSPPEPS